MSDVTGHVEAVKVSGPSERVLVPGGEIEVKRDLLDRLCTIFRVGWRPASGWVCVSILFVNGAVLPLARLKGLPIEPLDWHQLTPFAALLIGQGCLRTIEKTWGGST